ncbi:hypothetical protein [Streptomyces sp. NPDC088733]|uniref:hypothetical protein n=1 Tax=Streptomyces sp. NPDC088733 TaxID=3365880 RepID=UPI0038299570
MITVVVLAGIPLLLSGNDERRPAGGTWQGTDADSLRNIPTQQAATMPSTAGTVTGGHGSPDTSATRRPPAGSPTPSPPPSDKGLGQGSADDGTTSSSEPTQPTAAGSQQAPAKPLGDNLKPLTVTSTRALALGDSIVNGPTALTLQTSGNLVVTHHGTVTWSSGTTGHGATAVFQEDGNFVVYSTDGSTAWSTRTDGHNGAVLMIGTNGNIRIVYQNSVLWQTGTVN